MAGGPLRIDSRPSRWSVTRETERGGGGRAGGKSWRGTDILGLSLPSAKAEDWSTENIGQGGGQEEEGEEGRRVVERWKVEKRRQ